MVKRLVIHIGDCKAGSTSLQRALRTSNSDVFYGAKLNHNLLAFLLFDPFESERANGVFAKLGADLLARPEPVGVLSAEMLEFANPERLKTMMRSHFGRLAGGAKLVVYIRPHHDRVVSGYAETIKKGDFTGDIEQYIDHLISKGELNYSERLHSWRDAFGENLIIRRFSPGSSPGESFVAGFFEEILQVPPPRETERRENAALKTEQLAFLRAIHLRWRAENDDGGVDGADAFGWNVGALMALQGGLGATRLALSTPQRQRITVACAKDAEAVDAMAFEDGFLSAALHAPGDASSEAQADLSEHSVFTEREREMIDLFARVLGHLRNNHPAEFKLDMATLLERFRKP